MTYTNEMVLPKNFAMHSEEEMMYLDGGSRKETRAAQKAAIKAAITNVVGLFATSIVIAHHNCHTSYTVTAKRGGRKYTVTYKAPDTCSMPKIVSYIVGQLSWI